MNARRLYTTPGAFRVALEERVKALAKTLGHLDPTRQRQLLLADRLLARVSLEFGDAVFAKGGIALELRLPQARATQDLDLHTGSRRWRDAISAIGCDSRSQLIPPITTVSAKSCCRSVGEKRSSVVSQEFG
jgi:hypothetical protein